MVSAGGAGLFASIEAADRGSKTVILESDPVRLGSSPISGGIVTLCETEMQPGKRDELFADLMASHCQDCDAELVWAYVDYSAESY